MRMERVEGAEWIPILLECSRCDGGTIADSRERKGGGERRRENRITYPISKRWPSGALLKPAGAVRDAVCSSRNSRGRNRDLSANIGCRCMPLLTSTYQSGIRRNACPTAQWKASPSKVRCRGVRTYTSVHLWSRWMGREWATFSAFCLCSKIDTRSIKTRYVNESSPRRDEGCFIPEKCATSIQFD